MLIETKILNSKTFTPPYNLPPEETVYFDIETTGFSADITALYLIGCIYYDDGKWKLIQWFAEDKLSEKEALTAFSEFLQDKKYLLCYNGTTFDLPYLRKKYEKHNLEFNTDKFEIIDEPGWEKPSEICKVEMWNYDPVKLCENGIVDKLSLYASLKDTKDPRVQGELENVLEECSGSKRFR